MSKNKKQTGGKGKGKGDDDFALLQSFTRDLELKSNQKADQGKNTKGAAGSAASNAKPATAPIPATQLTDVSGQEVAARGLFKRKAAQASEDSTTVAAVTTVSTTEPTETTTSDETKEVQSKKTQTSPPTIPVSQLFEDKIFPMGEISNYNSTTTRTTPAELRAMENIIDDKILNEVREAAEVHRQCRLDIQKYIRPGVALIDIAQRLERSTKTLLGADGLKRGWGFPTGLSINHCAAHYSPNPGDTTVLGANDVLKVDFGTHINGRIIDCAFTVHFNPVYDKLVEAVQEATEIGVKTAAIDVRMCDIGAAIQEVMESYEVELRNRTYPVQIIRNLNGHNIRPYKIHGGKSVPLYDNHDQAKMEENEFFAIETFGSIAGRGMVVEDNSEVSHYMQDFNHGGLGLGALSAKARGLYNTINSKFGTLAFCRRWVEDEVGDGYSLALRQLQDAGIINPYPALNDIRGSYTAQFEHTLLIRESSKEILSRGFDY